jgi:hypothetical protein
MAMTDPVEPTSGEVESSERAPWLEPIETLRRAGSRRSMGRAARSPPCTVSGGAGDL